MGTDPPTLSIYSIKDKKSLWSFGNLAARSFAWTQPGTLLYCSLDLKAYKAYAEAAQSHAVVPTSAPGAAGQAAATPQPRPAPRPDIYEVPAAGGKAKLVLRDGYHPVASPDGKWIACFSSTDEKKGITPTVEFHPYLPRQSYLCLYNRAEGARTLVQPVGDYYPALCWTPDSKRLLVTEGSYGSRGSLFDKGRITAVEVATLAKKEIAVLQVKGFDSRPPQELFQPLKVSTDGAFLFVKLTEFVSKNTGDLFANQMESLHAVDLRNGKVTTLAKLYNEQSSLMGLDWFDESVPQKAPPR
jgi:hypothetical protein